MFKKKYVVLQIVRATGIRSLPGGKIPIYMSHVNILQNSIFFWNIFFYCNIIYFYKKNS